MAPNAEHHSLVVSQFPLGSDYRATVVTVSSKPAQLAVLVAKLASDVSVVAGGGWRVNAATVNPALLTHEHVGIDDVDAESVP